MIWICSNDNLSSVVTVQPLTKKRKISWRLLKIEYQLFPPIPWPLPPAQRGGKGHFFCGFLQAGYARLQKSYFFSPPPQRRMRRWGGGRGWGKSYRPQRFLHRRLTTWRQAEQLPSVIKSLLANCPLTVSISGGAQRHPLHVVVRAPLMPSPIPRTGAQPARARSALPSPACPAGSRACAGCA